LIHSLTLPVLPLSLHVIPTISLGKDGRKNMRAFLLTWFWFNAFFGGYFLTIIPAVIADIHVFSSVFVPTLGTFYSEYCTVQSQRKT
jgi:hypothetical protein